MVALGRLEKGGFGYEGVRPREGHGATMRHGPEIHVSPSSPRVLGGEATKNKGGRGGRYMYLRPVAHRCAMALSGPNSPIAKPALLQTANARVLCTVASWDNGC